MTSAVESVTVAVRDLDAAVHVFARTLGLRKESDTRASVSLLGAWCYPVHADVHLIELSSDGYPFGKLRLAHFDAGPGTATASGETDSAGAIALAVYGDSEPVVKALTDAGFERVRSDGQARYRNDENLEVLLLPGKDSPRGAVPDGRISEVASVVIHSRDPAAAEGFYQAIGLVAAEGSPRVLRDRQQPSGAIQITRLEGTDMPVPIHALLPGHRYGINLLTLRCSDLDALETRLRANPAHIVTRPTHVAIGDGIPARVMLVRGPDGELLELIELHA